MFFMSREDLTSSFRNFFQALRLQLNKHMLVKIVYRLVWDY